MTRGGWARVRGAGWLEVSAETRALLRRAREVLRAGAPVGGAAGDAPAPDVSAETSRRDDGGGS